MIKVDQHLEQFEVLLPSPTTFAFARWIFQVVDQLCEVEEKSKRRRKAGSRCQVCSLNFCIEDKIYRLIFSNCQQGFHEIGIGDLVICLAVLPFFLCSFPNLSSFSAKLQNYNAAPVSIPQRSACS